MGLSCFRAISGIGLGWDWDLCAGLFYEHRFAMLISHKWDELPASGGEEKTHIGQNFQMSPLGGGASYLKK